MGCASATPARELRAFLLAGACGKGHKTVLVITGKGVSEEPADGLGDLLGERQRGVIRRSVPHWLEEPDLRAIVLSYTQAASATAAPAPSTCSCAEPRADRDESD